MQMLTLQNAQEFISLYMSIIGCFTALLIPINALYYSRIMTSLGEDIIQDHISFVAKYTCLTSIEIIGFNPYMFYNILVGINVINLIYRYCVLSSCTDFLKFIILN